ncbi:MAG: 50S ribosomal protein L9 [Nitrospinales bacterium]
MKLLLQEDVPNLGLCGDEVDVKDGYGRNYLIPAGKAILATPKNLKAFNHQKSIIQAKLKKLQNSAEEFAGKIEKISCVFTKKVGDHGKLFGSVTSQEIADFLKTKGVEIDRHKIQLKEPIKALGEFKVPLRLHPEVTAQINVAVAKEAVKEEEAKTEGAKEAGKKQSRKKAPAKAKSAKAASASSADEKIKEEKSGKESADEDTATESVKEKSGEEPAE